jgi:BirA family biotin operon repressor/biotin-[acetyl-CoA-carboxylase] ligase
MHTRDRLITALKDHKGQWVSGEALSAGLDVTRAAVWKHIRSLRSDGYTIEASPKKGYRLQKTSRRVLPNEIRDGLKTRVFGRQEIVHILETESTNSEARKLAEQGAVEGTLVLAEAQKCGRGRKGRAWFSPSFENIYLSFLLRPGFPPVEAPRLTLLTAVAAAETLRTSGGVRAHIKWPNDILVGKRKIAGILTEISAEMDLVNYIVAGIGINVNTGRFPDGIEKEATSLLLETGNSFSRAGLITPFLNRFEEIYNTFMKTGFSPVLKKWKALSEMIGQRVRVEHNGREKAGEVTDVDQEGALLIRDQNRGIHRITFGDVHLM